MTRRTDRPLLLPLCAAVLLLALYVRDARAEVVRTCKAPDQVVRGITKQGSAFVLKRWKDCPLVEFVVFFPAARLARR